MLGRVLWTILALVLMTGAGVMLWDRFAPRTAPSPLVLEIDRIDHILIEKSERRLTAMVDGQVVMQVPVALGFSPAGDKVQEGDGKTPLGKFVIDRRNPNSAFHLSLGLNYPRPQDIARAETDGVDPGSDIFIHGQPNGIVGISLPGDWTAGCIAISNAQMAQLWSVTPIGTPVEIRP
ncbi:murein L,D-transpeptidase family protein [Tropicibacter sp. Alg240-R139]|uniref:L,D-transpeptidase family protein n=1 Tax=Tropicibacter sp. Alg240-R139 TaxID=2305991 RepID=UPI0013DFBF24|nr:L,D-transpeptidase family protein [Tropicibacter sp. Alg240-R139]